MRRLVVHLAVFALAGVSVPAALADGARPVLGWTHASRDGKRFASLVSRPARAPDPASGYDRTVNVVAKVGNADTSSETARGESVPRCVARQLRVSLGTFSAATGRIGGAIRFRNHGNLCSLRGYPDVDGLAADGRVGERARHILTGFLGGATHIATVTVAHDQTASAFLQGYDCAFLTPPPHGYRNLEITAPGTRHSVRLTLRYPLCGLKIEPIVPGRSGLS
jgi:hypothetical protein